MGVCGSMNYGDVTFNGDATYSTGNHKKLSMRPTLIAGNLRTNKPASVTVGCHAGYLMPIYSSDYELFFREYIAGRWDGTSNIIVSVICALNAAEDVGDNFKLQLSWENASTTGIISTSTTDVPVETTVATSRNSQYSVYKVQFTVAYATPNPDVTAGDHIAFRLRRLDATDPDITGDIIILDIIITYDVDKVFKST